MSDRNEIKIDYEDGTSIHIEDVSENPVGIYMQAD
jgi:hypothetical protein